MDSITYKHTVNARPRDYFGPSDHASPCKGNDAGEYSALLKRLRVDTGRPVDTKTSAILDERSLEDETILLVHNTWTRSVRYELSFRWRVQG